MSKPGSSKLLAISFSVCLVKNQVCCILMNTIHGKLIWLRSIRKKEKVWDSARSNRGRWNLKEIWEVYFEKKWTRILEMRFSIVGYNRHMVFRLLCWWSSFGLAVLFASYTLVSLNKGSVIVLGPPLL